MARRDGLNGRPRDRAEEVYTAALRLFREKGYHATSMQDIAAAVGLYKGSLYHYIGGKEDLLAEVFARGMGSLLEDVERIAADGSVPPTDQLRAIVCAHVAAVTRNLDALTVYLHEFRALADGTLASVREQHERYTRLVSDIVRQGVASGEFQTDDVGLATLALLGMCNWLCQWYRPDGRLGPAEIGRSFADLVLCGLATSSSRQTVRPASRRTSESARRNTSS